MDHTLRPGVAVKPLRARSSGLEYGLRLFCFPYAGAGASVFRGLSGLMPPAVQTFGIQLPGREERWHEPNYSALAPLVEDLARQIVHYMDLPTVFFGHSFGALIAYEVASWLERHAQDAVGCLVVSAANAPCWPRAGPLLHRLTDERFVAELESLGGFPPEVLQHTELLSLVLPTLRADVKLYETYEHSRRARLDAPVCAFGGSIDSRIPPQQLLGWSEVTNHFLGVQVFSGGHFYLQQSPQAVARSIVAAAAPHLVHARVSQNGAGL